MFRRKFMTALGVTGLLSLCLSSGCASKSQTSNGDESNSGGATYKAVLPEALTPEIAEFSEGSTSGATNKPSREPADHACDLGSGVIIKAHRHLDIALAWLAAKLNADLIASGTTDGHLAGTYVGENGTGAYKADFSPFDIDGDGTADGSGDPRTLPVALRLWVDPENDGSFVPFLCGLITAYPSLAHTGAGEIYIHPVATSSESDPTFQLYIKWDHTDSASKFNEGYLKGVLGDDIVVGNGHIHIDFTTLSNASVQKTLQSVATFTGDAIGAHEFDYAARTLKGLGFATVKGKASGSAINGEFTACVSLAQCTLSIIGCQAIDSAGLEFLSAPTGAETDFPADFPAAPTF